MTIFPFFRFSIPNCKVCWSGGTRGAEGGGHLQSASSLPQRSQVGGRSNGVPANNRIGDHVLIFVAYGLDLAISRAGPPLPYRSLLRFFAFRWLTRPIAPALPTADTPRLVPILDLFQPRLRLRDLFAGLLIELRLGHFLVQLSDLGFELFRSSPEDVCSSWPFLVSLVDASAMPAAAGSAASRHVCRVGRRRGAAASAPPCSFGFGGAAAANRHSRRRIL